MQRSFLFILLLPLLLFSCSPKIGSTRKGKDGMILLYVPAGEFTMGSEFYDDEQPIHTVYLDAFWIDQTEVTVHMYSMCVEAGVCVEPENISSFTRLSYYGNSEFDNYPVIYVSWNMAKSYCEWVGRRLPTEAEWEKAARGTDGRTYPWGEKINCSLANYWDGSDRCGNDTTKVGSYLGGASIYGALDMAGNVWEYVNDWYSETYYFNSPTSNPLGPESGQYRVVRGGSWFDWDDVVRSTFRSWVTPVGGDYSATDNQGFRCAISATP
ncbi:MAG TPA: formylglycine-generating enzyme family protein [Anaerolineales bacterium]|nr:formylglycine-generating enzyme family protein [Anaerolineales bacterium]